MVRAPRSHRGGRRFKSFIAHHADGTFESGPSCLGLLCRGGGTADALRSGRSVLTDVWVQIPPSAPPEPGRSQSLAGLTGQRVREHWNRYPWNRHLVRSCACSSVDRALPCGGRGRGFESRQAHHFLSTGQRRSPDPNQLLHPLVGRVNSVNVSPRIGVDLVRVLESTPPR